MRNQDDTIGSGEFSLPYDLFDLLLTFLAAYGVPPTKLIERSDITEQQLLSRPAYVGNNTYNAAITLLLESTQDPYMSMKFGLAMSNRSHGMFGLAIQSSQDLAEVYEILPTLFVTRSGYAQVVTTTTHAECIEITVHSGRAGAPEAFGQFNSLSTITNFAWLTRKITGTELQEVPDEIDVVWPEPAQTMPALLLPPGTRINYSKPANLLRHKISHLRSHVISSNPALQQAAIRECELQLSSLPNTNVVEQVRWVFRILHPAFPVLETVAGHLHMSSPTLKRKLKARETTFHKLKDEIRFTRVLKLLESNNFTLDEIAQEVDFDNSSNLARAFKKRFGYTPGEYKNSRTS